MNRLKRHWWWIARVFALLLVLGTLWVGYYWHYSFGPHRNLFDSVWVKKHSELAKWEELKRGLKRHSWMHDDFSMAGKYGDKDFITWAMTQTKSGEDISSCVAGHRDTAFSMMINQNLGEEAEPWLAWWAENSSKRQVEWIQDGFAQIGVSVVLPPRDEDWIPLLNLLGDTKEESDEKVPDYVKYNAFRWLRDSGFDPLDFALHDSEELKDPTIKKGLARFYVRQWTWLSQGGLGRLDFEHLKPTDVPFEYPGIDILDLIANVSVVMMPIAALLLLSSSRKRTRRRPIE